MHPLLVQDTSSYLSELTMKHRSDAYISKSNESKQMQSFALNMGSFYLASELPRGENCHILAVGFSQFWGKPGRAEQER